ncbi:MAG: AMP-binding protein [Streptosporangiales bacterium]|nr:AMP-binding protein [Streptosporangiales bacterium]
MSATFVEVLRNAAIHRADRTAVHVAGEAPVSYAELWEAAGGVATALQVHHPEARHVALVLGNSAQWVAGLYGTALAGRTAVLLNPQLTESELRYQIEQADCAVVLAGPVGRAERERRRPAVLEAAGGADVVVEIVWAGDDAPAGTVPWGEWVDVPPPAEPAPEPAEEDTAVIIYTSGTTALPKGVMLGHGSVVRNAHHVGRSFGLRESDQIFSAGPFFHSGGLTLHVLLAGLYGIPALSTPSFDPDGVLDFVEETRPTIYNGIETLFLRLADSPRFAPSRLSSVRTGWSTGTPAVLHTIAEDIGVPGVIGVYGISEASPNVTISPWRDTPEHRLETVGRPQPQTTVVIWDDARERAVQPGETGEILVRGPGLMQGYYRRPEETAEALRGGYLHTGDLGRMRPDGYLEFAGRIKDIVRMGGENISCAEVENAIYALGGVELAAVLPIEDDRYGQVPVAVVVPSGRDTGGSGGSEDELIKRLSANLAGYKLPKRVLFVEEMPLTESGKVQKGRLRDRILPLL